MNAIADPAPRPAARVPLVGVMAGTACSIVLFALAKWVRVAEIDAGRYTKMSVGLLIFVWAGLFIGRAVRRTGHPHTMRIAAGGFGASLIGIAAGTVFWTFIEDSVFSRFGEYPVYQEHTLFPIEVALLWMFGAIPILAGIAAGMMLTGGTNDSQPTTNN